MERAVKAQGGLQWARVTPALFIPIVGNVLVPLAGVPLGQAEWSAAQFGVGLLFWPVVMVLIVVRIAVQGLWPERLLPTAFILIAPPAVVGLAALQFGAPPLVGWALWGMAMFTALWAGTLTARIAKLPFGLPHWGMSFPLAALAALTLRLAAPGGALAVLGPVLLALASLVVLALLLGTLRGLRDGWLLAPEPVARLQPVRLGLPGAADMRGYVGPGHPSPGVSPCKHPATRAPGEPPCGRRAAAAAAARCRRWHSAKKDTAVLAMTLAGAHGLDPTAGAASAIAEITLYNVFETLTKITSDGRTVPLLAESWTVTPDLQTWTFKLRRGLSFHNGEPSMPQR